MKTLLFSESADGVEVQIEIALEQGGLYLFKVGLNGDRENFAKVFRAIVPRVCDVGQGLFGVHNWLGVVTSEFTRDPLEGTVLKIWSRSYPRENIVTRLFEANFN